MQQNIHVHGVAPAAMAARINDTTPPAVPAYMFECIPMGRIGQMDDVAALSHWLCSDECSFTNRRVWL